MSLLFCIKLFWMVLRKTWIGVIKGFAMYFWKQNDKKHHYKAKLFGKQNYDVSYLSRRKHDNNIWSNCIKYLLLWYLIKKKSFPGSSELLNKIILSFNWNIIYLIWNLYSFMKSTKYIKVKYILFFLLFFIKLVWLGMCNTWVFWKMFCFVILNTEQQQKTEVQKDNIFTRTWFKPKWFYPKNA